MIDTKPESLHDLKVPAPTWIWLRLGDPGEKPRYLANADAQAVVGSVEIYGAETRVAYVAVSSTLDMRVSMGPDAKLIVADIADRVSEHDLVIVRHNDGRLRRAEVSHADVDLCYVKVGTDLCGYQEDGWGETWIVGSDCDVLLRVQPDDPAAIRDVGDIPDRQYRIASAVMSHTRHAIEWLAMCDVETPWHEPLNSSILTFCREAWLGGADFDRLWLTNIWTGLTADGSQDTLAATIKHAMRKP